jgi:hypothetical protein
MARIAWAACAAGLLASTPAFALDPYMWGVGPKLGTNMIPGRFPATFNTTLKNDGFIEPVGFDILVGADAYYYTSSRFRMGLTASGDFGGHYWDLDMMAKAHVIVPSGDVDLLLGGALGAGYLQFGGTNAEDQPVRYAVPYYPVRAEAGVLIHDTSRAYGLTIFAEYKLPSSQRYVIGDNPAQTGSDLSGFGFWGTLGLEVSVLFGDFEPPRPHRRNP